MAKAVIYIDIFLRFKKMHDFRGGQPIESIVKQRATSMCWCIALPEIVGVFFCEPTVFK